MKWRVVLALSICIVVWRLFQLLTAVPPAMPPCPTTDTGVVVVLDANGEITARALPVVGCP